MSFIIREIKFVKSSPDLKSCPEGDLPEYAFVGRSNVGKSSLINYIAGIEKLAKTSADPGRTRLINHFIVDDSWYLVDLPGYGYAKISKSERVKFDILIKEYLNNRDSLACLFLLIDCRHSPQKNDLEFMEWLGENGVPFVICFTKTDKLSKSKLEKSLATYHQTMLENWETLPEFFQSSTLDNKGKEEILKFIGQTNKLFKNRSSI
jgi:GTP-binding protein